MTVHYYLSFFPVEALIASNLEPEDFGLYIAAGNRTGSYEGHMFIEIEGGFGADFDWEFARQKCVPRQDGSPKNSLYLSVYRALENIPLSALRKLYLTTRDGRSLGLEGKAQASEELKREFWVYQELCPIRPLAVSSLDPAGFAKSLTDAANKVYVPKIVFADLKVVDFNNPHTGNIGPTYDRNVEHLKNCIKSVTTKKTKPSKIVERSNVDRFTYQIIDRGIYVGDGAGLVGYRMPSADELRRRFYDWGRSAQIL